MATIRKGRLRVLLGAAAVLSGVIFAVTYSSLPTSSSATGQPCSAGFAAPIFVPVDSAPLDEIRFDDGCTRLYISNPTKNQIEVYSLQAKSLEAPILVGSGPKGFDITPDGKTMYVANSGGTNISVVDLATKQELRRIDVPSGFSNDRPLSIAIAANGLAFFSTTFSGSGFGGRLMQLDLATDAVSVRHDFYIGGSTTEATFLRAGQDRSKIGVVVGDISSGPVFTYTSATNSFSGETDLGGCGYRGYVASDAAGSRFLVGACPGTQVLDANLSLVGSIALGTSIRSFGVALMPDGKFGFRAVEAGVDILDLTRFLSIGTLPVGDLLGSAHPATYPARMAISADGGLLAVSTDHGFSVLAASTAPPATATPTNTPTATSTSTPIPTATPAVSAGGAKALLGVAGVVAFGPRYETGATVSFDKPMKTGDYAVLLTPENRNCIAVVTGKGVGGFSFSCGGLGGRVDWLVVTRP